MQSIQKDIFICLSHHRLIKHYLNMIKHCQSENSKMKYWPLQIKSKFIPWFLWNYILISHCFFFLFSLICLLGSVPLTRPCHSWLSKFNFLCYLSLNLKTQSSILQMPAIDHKIWAGNYALLSMNSLILLGKYIHKHYWVKHNIIIFMC